MNIIEFSMTDYRIHFKDIAWEKPTKGVEQKIVSNGTVIMRLLRFNDDFVEEHWCTKGHVGYVLDGKMTIDFNGKLETYKKGDGLWIEAGEANKHKASIAKGTFVEMILFEVEN